VAVVTLFARRGQKREHEFNVRWLKAARRVLKPEGTLWVMGTHDIIFSIGFALQWLGFRIIKYMNRAKGCMTGPHCRCQSQ
jgi:DNA modification methylase